MKSSKAKGLNQSKTKFYVCIRERDEYGYGANLKDRVGPFEMPEAYEMLTFLIDRYGPSYQVVIEPVEFSD